MKKQYDVVIVGGGIAGLFAALHLDPALSVLLLTKRELSLSNSDLAQGGIAAVFDTERDSVRKHINDTLAAGGFINNRHAVETMVNEGPADVRRLIELGVCFDCDSNGKIHLTLEGGHTRHRILHHKDCTGREIIDKLSKAVQSLPNVTLWEQAQVCDIVKTGQTFHLDILLNNQQRVSAAAFSVILATGGIGRVYEYTTNSAISTGDGIALAYRLGAKIKNLHYIQFHPTAFANRQTRESFLISESVRGEGAYLRNCHGERFMHLYDDRLELAPRDVVSGSIMEEAKRTGSNEFYLDMTHKDAAYIKERFPMIHESLYLQGFDLSKDKIPIFPCQHYLMGGIDVGLQGQTTIEGLYACGECSHTGVHGANRLASNSLLEGVVFSRRAAQDVNKRLACRPEYTHHVFVSKEEHMPVPPGVRTEIRAIMQSAYFVTPDRESLKQGFERICALREMLETLGFIADRDYVEARSLATIAWLVLKEVV